MRMPAWETIATPAIIVLLVGSFFFATWLAFMESTHHDPHTVLVRQCDTTTVYEGVTKWQKNRECMKLYLSDGRKVLACDAIIEFIPEPPVSLNYEELSR